MLVDRMHFLTFPTSFLKGASKLDFFRLIVQTFQKKIICLINLNRFIIRDYI
jgi:hypothetical protein